MMIIINLKYSEPSLKKAKSDFIKYLKQPIDPINSFKQFINNLSPINKANVYRYKTQLLPFYINRVFHKNINFCSPIKFSFL